MQVCAKICETSAAFMLAGSEFHTRTCGVCSEVCRACEQSCRSMAAGDQTMKQCADMCKRCSASCEQMAMAAA
jgi:hypothetical protein